MSKFDIPVIVQVEAATIDEARQRAYKAIQTIEEPGSGHSETIYAAMVGIEMSMADDSQTDNYNHRLVFLHPSDVDANYSPEEYEAGLDKELEKDQE